MGHVYQTVTGGASSEDRLRLNGYVEKIVPGYRYLVSWKDLYATFGDFTDFTDNIVIFTGKVSKIGEVLDAATRTVTKVLPAVRARLAEAATLRPPASVAPGHCRLR